MKILITFRIQNYSSFNYLIERNRTSIDYLYYNATEGVLKV